MHWKYPLICFIKYTTLRFKIDFPFFIFQVLQMLLHFQYLYVKHRNKHDNQQFNVKAILKKRFQSTWSDLIYMYEFDNSITFKH